MVKNYQNFNYTTSPITVNGMVLTMQVKRKNENTQVYLLLNNSEIYDKISIKLPETKKLNGDQFFLDPRSAIEIIKELENQNFIQKTDILAKSGDLETFAYNII